MPSALLRRRWRSCVFVVALAVLVIAGCSADETAASRTAPDVQAEAEPTAMPAAAEPTEVPAKVRCADLEEAIVAADELFLIEDLQDMDVATSQRVEDLLVGVADGLPASAPAEASEMLAAAASMLGGLGDAASADDPGAAFRTIAAPAQEVFDQLDWEPVESFFAEECGIDNLGLELRLRSDDTTTATSSG